MNRRPERLADLLPAVVADLAAQHTTNGETMSKFRKRPVVIEARQWLPDDLEAAAAVINWLADSRVGHSFEMGFGVTGDYELEIRTLEDGHDGRANPVASPGDWIIRGVQGEFYPCKPDIFEATYEPVDGAA